MTSVPLNLFAPCRQQTTVKEHERKRLLERINREGATVGTRIPERIDLQGDPFDLREFVLEVKRRDTVPPEDQERVTGAKKRLRRERVARRQVIEAGEVSVEEGERLAESIVGLDRALNALESLEPTDLEAEATAKETADRKRWLNFLKQALGHDDGRRPRA